MDASALVGTWRLISWDAIGADGSIERPMGGRPEGLLSYAADGMMLVLLGTGDRARISGSDISGSSVEERAEAMRTFIAYGGRYELAGSRVTHHVEMSLYPNWVGTRQVREASFDATGNRLTLVSPPIAVGGSARSQHVTWERRAPG